ncbi:MAG: hypothetical protein ABIR57_03645 [Aeromicrobium sp.]
MALDQHRENLVSIVLRILLCAALCSLAIPLAFAIRDRDFIGQPNLEGVITSVESTTAGATDCSSNFYVVRLSDGEGDLGSCVKTHAVGDIVTVRESRGSARDLTEQVPSTSSYAKAMIVVFMALTIAFGLVVSLTYVVQTARATRSARPKRKTRPKPASGKHKR